MSTHRSIILCWLFFFLLCRTQNQINRSSPYMRDWHKKRKKKRIWFNNGYKYQFSRFAKTLTPTTNCSRKQFSWAHRLKYAHGKYWNCIQDRIRRTKKINCCVSIWVERVRASEGAHEWARVKKKKIAERDSQIISVLDRHELRKEKKSWNHEINKFQNKSDFAKSKLRVYSKVL